MGNSFEIWSDSLVEADWFSELDPRLRNSKILTIGSRGTNKPIVDSLIRYDRPDIILLKDNQPILVVEKTQEVPTGHNVGQRVARLIRAAEYQVPTFFFLPFDARKHGKYTSMCSLNTRLIKALLKASEIHESPVLPVNWPCDSDGELIMDGSENQELALLVGSVLDGNLGAEDSPIANHFRKMKKELSSREASYPPYSELPKSAKILNTRQFLLGINNILDESLPLLRRQESLVYTMDMSPASCKRQDPYTGMQFIYDYGWLRNGPRPSDRNVNLILHVPQVSLAHWNASNPENYMSKSCNWYLIADAIILNDGIIEISNWPIHHVS